MATFTLNLNGIESVDGAEVPKAASDVAVVEAGQVSLHEGPQGQTPEIQTPQPSQDFGGYDFS